jgi:menaquinone-dependent protoporphyrinogen IX oxidase
LDTKKVLLAYATRYGSTETIARDIEKALSENGVIVQRVDLKNVNFKDMDPKSYNGVIVGASVAMFRLHPAAKKFLKHLCKQLKGSGVPLIIFIASGTAIKDPAKAEAKWITKYVEKYGLEPALTMAVEPCMVMTASTKPNVKGVCKALAKDAGIEFDPKGMNDMRDKERFGAFLERTLAVLRREGH